MPAIAPFDSLLDDETGVEEDVGPDRAAVGDDMDVDVLGVGVMKSSLVTLKHGGVMVISAASTKVYELIVRNNFDIVFPM